MEAIGGFIKNFVLNENRFILETIFFEIKLFSFIFTNDQNLTICEE